MKKLAINGGTKIRNKKFPAYNTIGDEEREAVLRVLDNGKLSRYLGAWHEDFRGGEEVRSLEEEWAKYFGVKHAISVNSATSGLYCAVGAAGIGLGDEVIVSPYTMSASATASLIYNAVPVFADIDPDYFIIDPESLEERITERTKAIIVVDIYGHPYDADKINKIAKKHNLIVIEDAAQAPGAMYKGEMAGTLGDMGVYSLNYHKHIHSGEGGIIVTNSDELADKLRLIRNHAEAVLEGKGYDDLTNMIGFNYRMTEIEAAVAREQLRKLPELLDSRLENVKYINEMLKDIPFLKLPKVMEDCKHAYYVHGIKYIEEIAGISREKFVEALKAELMEFELRETEGVKIGAGYVKPLYLLPIYQNKIAYGKDGFPFNQECYKDVDYSKGICPICEDMHFNQMITHEFMVPSMTKDDMDDFINAIKKVWENIDELK